MVSEHPTPGVGSQSEVGSWSADEPDAVAGPARAGAHASESSPGRPEYGVFWLDLNGRVTRWSDEAAALFGHPLEETTRLRFHDLFSEDDRANSVPDRALEVVREQGVWDGVGWRVTREGRTFWAVTSLTMACTPNGLRIGLMAVTRKLDPSPTSGAGGPATNRLVSLGRVASDVSHDVRNILTAIRGFAELLEQRIPLEGGSYQLWHELVKTCDRGADLTQRILGLARSDEDATEVVRVAETLRSLYPMLRQIVPDRIQLKLDAADDVPPIMATRHDIELAVLNVVVNARDAIRGMGCIRIELRHEAMPHDAGDGRVVLSVRDSGMGMTSDIQDRIFDRFFTTKDPGEGTGLGMAVVRDSMRAVGGSIEIESTQGEGTTVRLVFQPLSVRALGDRPRPESEGSGVTASLRPTRVLVCCTSPILATLSAELLRRAGASVYVSPEEEGAGSSDRDFDVLVVDATSGTPGAVLKGGGDRHDGPPVVMLCEPGHTTDHDAELAGVRRILTMPVDPVDLYEAVAELASTGPSDVRLSVH